MTGQHSLIFDVVMALADADAVEPAGLDYNLSDTIDPEVLSTLADMDATGWAFTFEAGEHEVTVLPGGRVLVDGVPFRRDISVEDPVR